MRRKSPDRRQTRSWFFLKSTIVLGAVLIKLLLETTATSGSGQDLNSDRASDCRSSDLGPLGCVAV